MFSTESEPPESWEVKAGDSFDSTSLRVVDVR